AVDDTWPRERDRHRGPRSRPGGGDKQRHRQGRHKHTSSAHQGHLLSELRRGEKSDQKRCHGGPKLPPRLGKDPVDMFFLLDSGSGSAAACSIAAQRRETACRSSAKTRRLPTSTRVGRERPLMAGRAAVEGKFG